ncbi:5-hydroxytryptamine receptor 3A-like [Epinephelus moara]|uniref:5-hydroxytryptamine receptor 3A-like n=1 Tax=Epinephelus moara TaxID=300413 RepID=UPI00214F1036|nr:5-hydroxytryptamine receptor 3A-like [Epinephelus moara]
MMEVKTVRLIFICFSLLHGFAEALRCTSPTLESLFEALEREVFNKKHLRPVKKPTDALNVSVGMTLEGILGVNEKAQSVTSLLWQVLEWDIEGLSWDEKECGVRRVSVPRDKLWIPDVIIAEIMDEDTSPFIPYVYLYNTGRVYDDRPLRMVTSCRLEIYTFPFDIQNCSLTFGPFLHLVEDVRMFARSSAEEILAESRNVMQIQGEWELLDIIGTPRTLNIIAGSYSEIRYYIILRRRPILYVVNLLMPSCFLITLDLFSFLLPPHSVDRSSFKMTLILGYTVFLLLMNDLLPVTGNSTPLMNVFFSISLALMVASLLETVFITNIQLSGDQHGVMPNWLKVLVLRYLAVIVCVPQAKRNRRVAMSPHAPARAMNISSVSVDTPPVTPLHEPALDELRKLSKDLMAIRHHVDKHFKGNHMSQEWQMMGIVIDRLLFGLYILFILICLITIVCIWTLSSSHVSS